MVGSDRGAETGVAGFTIATWLTTLGLLIVGLITYDESVKALKNRLSTESRPPAREEFQQLGASGNDEDDKSHASSLFHSNNVVTLAPR